MLNKRVIRHQPMSHSLPYWLSVQGVEEQLSFKRRLVTKSNALEI